jgi:hypothetical protein
MEEPVAVIEATEPAALPDPEQIPMPRWVTPVLTLAAACLLPWTLYLTFTLPSKQVAENYDIAWVGFDVALLAGFAATSWAALKGSKWLVPFAATTGTMLVCDAWFDIVTAQGGMSRIEAVFSAAFAELPLAAICAFIVYDAERFRHATVVRYASALRRLRGRGAPPT